MIDNLRERAYSGSANLAPRCALIAAGSISLPMGANADIIGNGPALGPPVGRTS